MIRKITNDRPFKILGFTDTHLDDYADRFEVTLKLMAETVETEKPDLVVFVGDNVTGGDNKARAKTFQKTMTQLKIPWAPVLGNHEGDNPKSMLRSEMVAEFRKSPYCLVPEKKPMLADGTEVFGETNFVIPLKNEEGKEVYKLIFLDCGPDTTPKDLARYGIITRKKSPDGYLKDNQIAWYREQVREDECPSMVFCHVPLTEFIEAYEKGERVAGINYEGTGGSPYNSGMFDAMLEEGKTKIFVVGHDHVNDSKVLYKGILLMYNRMSGMSSYNTISKKVADKLMQGATIYYIDAEGQVTFDDVIYEDRYPQYHDEIYSVIRKE